MLNHLRRFRLHLPLLLLLFLSGSAWAGADVPTPDADAAAWLQAIYTALTSKQWGVVSGLAMVGLVYLARRFGGAVFPWLKTATGGLFLGVLVGLLTTLGTTLAVGGPISWSVVAAAIANAAVSAGLWEWLKDHIPGVAEAADKASSQVKR